MVGMGLRLIAIVDNARRRLAGVGADDFAIGQHIHPLVPARLIDNMKMGAAALRLQIVCQKLALCPA